MPKRPPPEHPVDHAKYQAALTRLDRFSRLTDSAVHIPLTRIRIGLEPIIGLIPVVGDLAGLALSGYVLLEAQRAGADGAIKSKMVKNMLIDFVGGMVPIVGDAFDFVYKANVRNTRLLRDHLQSRLKAEPAPVFSRKQLIIVSLILAILTSGLIWAIS